MSVLFWFVISKIFANCLYRHISTRGPLPLRDHVREQTSKSPSHIAFLIPIFAFVLQVVLQPLKAAIVQRYCGVGVEGIILPRTRRVASGNYLDIAERFRPPLPPAFENKPTKDVTQFWARIKSTELLTTARTTMIGDGYSHGPRLHPEQRRLISVREFARSQGELLFLL